MDLSILLALQSFREGAGGIFTDFMLKMTWFGDLGTIPAMMALIYWCVSKELGAYVLLGWSGNRLLNGTLKVTACVYRPWIRDARIVPYGDSINTATGYSFPSGHITNASTVFGGLALRREVSRGLRIALVLVVLLVGLSRNYLGVHTPQDVLVGGTVGFLVMGLTSKLLNWLKEHPEKDVLVAGIGAGLFLLLALYAGLKSYPEDYNAEGQLIVDGAKMANDSFKAVGWGIGILLGWILERRYVGFSTDVPLMQKLSRCVFGMLGYYVLTLILAPLIKQGIAGPAGTVLTCFLQMFYVLFLFPWLLMRFQTQNTETVQS